MDILEIKELYKSIDKKKIINNISFNIEEGEIVGLVGKSGAGKSVLIKMIIGFLKQDLGEIKINNTIGYSMQENALYDYMTVSQNLNYFASINNISNKTRKEQIELLLKKLNLDEYKKVLVKNLSGGTKKRVDLACSLLANPKLLILDEPLLGLDPGLVNSLSQFILSINKTGTTILISSHQIEELSQICSRFILLEEGRLCQIKKENLKEVYK